LTSDLAYGIDYGTTNSSISIAYPDQVEVLNFNPDDPLPASLPSTVYLHRDGLRLAGKQAIDQFTITGGRNTACQRCSLVTYTRKFGYETDCRQYQRRSGCVDSRLMSELKSELTDGSLKGTHSWANDFEMEDLVAVVLAHLKNHADRQTGQDITRAVIGHPIAFFGTTGDRFDQRQDLAEARLEDAARRAGFTEVELYPEPVAAALDEVLEDGYVVTADFGGGTFDMAVTSIAGGEGEVVSMEGAAVGGSMFDKRIFESKVAPKLGLLQGSIPAWFSTGLSSLENFKYLLTNPHTFNVINDLQKLDHQAGTIVRSIIIGGQAPRFYKAIENAKIALSTAERSSIEFHPPQGGLSIDLSRAELDLIVAPYIETVEAQIMKALSTAKIEPDQVTTVLRTGGSSRLGSFVELLEGLFGAEKVREREPFTTVAYGLGIVAQETWL